MPKQHEAVAWCAWQLWRTPATAKLHKAALPSVPASQSQAPLVAATASRPSGEGNRLYAKLPSLESVAQPSALPGRWHALRAAICAPLWLSWHLGIGQALRAVWLVSGLRPVILCVPRPPCGLAAARLWPCAGLPVRPQGAPSAQRRGSRRLTAAGANPCTCGGIAQVWSPKEKSLLSFE